MNETIINIFWLIIGVAWIIHGLGYSSFDNPGLRFMARIGMLIVGIEVLIRHLS